MVIATKKRIVKIAIASLLGMLNIANAKPFSINNKLYTINSNNAKANANANANANAGHLSGRIDSE